jgi:hypothetical protein
LIENDTKREARGRKEGEPTGSPLVKLELDVADGVSEVKADDAALRERKEVKRELLAC